MTSVPGMTAWERPPLPPRWYSRTQPAFVGRGVERRALEQAWAAVLTGSRQVVFVGGEAGSGKTRLISEAACGLHREGAVALAGGCVEDLGDAYQPFVEPMSALLRLPGCGGWDDGPAGRLRRERVEHVVGRRDVVDSAEVDRTREVYDAVAESLRRVAAECPLVLVLEDIHWAGGTALALATYLVERTADSRILVLASHRTTAPDRSPDVVGVISALHRLDGVRRLDLTALDTEDIAEFLVREAGVARRRSRPLAAVLRDQTGGNPFFLREVSRQLRDPAILEAACIGDVAMPSSVRDVLAARLQRLPPGQRRVLEAAATMGEEFDIGELIAICSDQAASSCLDALDGLVSAGLVDRTPGEETVFRFPHALGRAAVLESMSASRRVTMHAQVAEVLAMSFPGARRRVHRLAHHYASAAALGFAEEAVDYLVRAATLADHGFAYAEAAALCSKAAMLADDPARRDALRLRAVDSYFLAGQFTEAQVLAETVCVEGTVEFRLRAAVRYEIGTSKPGQRGERSVELLTECLKHAPDGTTEAARISGIASLGRALAMTGQTGPARELAGRAVDLARECGDGQVLAHALETALWSGPRPGDTILRRARAMELTDFAHRLGRLDSVATAATFRAETCYALGDRAGFDAAATDSTVHATASRIRFFSYFALAIEQARAYAAGDLDTVSQLIARLSDLGRVLFTDVSDGPGAVLTFMLRRESDGLGAVRVLISGQEDPESHWAAGLLSMYTELGMADAAHRLLNWWLDQDHDAQLDSSLWPAELAFVTEAAYFLGDREAALRIRPLVEDHRGRNLMGGWFVAVFGAADRHLGALASLTGRRDADDLFDSALEMDARMGSRLHQSYTLALHARHLRRRGGRDADARRQEAAALALVEGLHLPRLRRLLPGSTMGAGRADGLTGREVQVLRLLGAGNGNRDIATALGISENTAANHVRSILAKTGSANRTTAAMYAERHGLLRGDAF